MVHIYPHLFKDSPDGHVTQASVSVSATCSHWIFGPSDQNQGLKEATEDMVRYYQLSNVSQIQTSNI